MFPQFLLHPLTLALMTTGEPARQSAVEPCPFLMTNAKTNRCLSVGLTTAQCPLRRAKEVATTVRVPLQSMKTEKKAKKKRVKEKKDQPHLLLRGASRQQIFRTTKWPRLPSIAPVPLTSKRTNRRNLRKRRKGARKSLLQSPKQVPLERGKGTVFLSV